MSTLDAIVLSALTPLDRLRAGALQPVGHLVRPLLRDRSRRIALLATLSVAVALACTLAAPLTLLTLGPLCLGVPHLLADLRYLVVRQGLHRRPRLLLSVAPFLALTIADPTLGWGSCAVAAAALAAEAPLGPRLLTALGCCAVALGARLLGPVADVFFAHAHNLVALAAWARWSRHPRALAPALSLFLIASAALLSGLCEPLLRRPAVLARGAFTLDAETLLAGLSPAQDPRLALRWLAFFAFAQAVHYSVWIKCIPEEDRARAGVRPFTASYRALRRDLGGSSLVLALVLSVGCVLWAGVDLSAARTGYLRLALFHGPLEIAVALLLVLERRPLQREG